MTCQGKRASVINSSKSSLAVTHVSVTTPGLLSSNSLEHDLSQLGTLGKDLDPAECDPSGICGVISLEGEQIANREGP